MVLCNWVKGEVMQKNHFSKKGKAYLVPKLTMADLFQNPSSRIDSLPQVDESQFEPMPARYKRLRWSVFMAVVILGLAALIFPAVWFAMSEEESVPGVLWVVFATMAVFIGIWAMEELRGFPIRGVLVRDHDLTFRSGYWVREMVTVPFNRIQHSEVSQGPLARAFGVCTLKLYTAGSSGANLRVPGLDFARAQQLRAFLDERAGQC